MNRHESTDGTTKTPTRGMHTMGLVLALFVMAWAPTALAGDQAGSWPSFRGPNGSGLGEGSPPVTWDVESGENVQWKVAIPGLGHASPIVHAGRVFVATAVALEGESTHVTGWQGGAGQSADDSGEHEWRVLCLDANTGETLWSHVARKGKPKSQRHIKASQANCTPATDGEVVAVSFGSEGLYVYDFEGKRLWSQDLGVMLSGPASAEGMEWGYSSSPIVHDGHVLLQCDLQDRSFWVAFDAKTGKEVRRVERGDDPTWATPSIAVDGDGKALVICNGYKQMAAYEFETGKKRWHLGGGGDVPVPRPVITGRRVVFSNAHGRLSPVYVIDVESEGDLTPSQDAEATPNGLVWWQPRRGSYMPTPIVVGDAVYVNEDNGVLTALYLENGAVLYKKRIPGGRQSTYTASPVAADGRLYITSESGVVDVIRAGESFEPLAQNRMNETCMATPAIASDRLYVRTAKHLYCIGETEKSSGDGAGAKR